MNNENGLHHKRILSSLPLVRALFLVLISRNPDVTGYQIIRLVPNITNNQIVLKTGTVYTELRRLEKIGLVRSTQSSSGRRQRHYQITEKGIKELRRLRVQIERRINLLLNPMISLIDNTLLNIEI
ncbi:MAG: PadR family transcriptional regulator [Candidatus Hodarchaeales archaeon]